jgi:murein DD-endopeptidase MepM/ murein hydrolase activator NlpD
MAAALTASAAAHEVRAAASPRRPGRADRSAGSRFRSPERLVPIVVAVFLVIGGLTAAPSVVGVGTGSDGSTARLVVGGEIGPNVGVDGIDGVDGPASAYDGTDGQAISADSAIAGDPTAAEVAGQFLEDGTLLKPVVVRTAVADGRTKLRTYRVRSGDTLTGIARRMGVSMMTLWWANKLRSKDDLKIGQVLIVPPVNGLIVNVGAGDTLDSIARANGMDADEIAAYNNLEDQTLVVGQVLILPGARGRAYPTPKPTKRPVASVSRSRPSAGRTGTPSRPIVRDPGHYGGGAFAWPVPGGHISQYFSYGHPAIDIAAPIGTPIVAAAGGTVIYAAWKNNGGGYQVWISHGSGLYTTYNHMSSVSVGVGQRVGRGQFIGRVGSTGNSTGPHCHFEVWRGPVWSGGARVNPLAYLR